MNSQIRNYCCLLVLLFIATLSYAQKQFHITIQFVPNLDSSNIIVALDNGKGMGQIPFVFKNGKIEINCKVYSRYATLALRSPLTLNQKTYFITKEVSKIIYYGKDKLAKDYPFTNNKLINAIELANCKEMKKFIDYRQKEFKDVVDFHEIHKAELNKNDSLKSILNQKYKILAKRDLDFIKANRTQYFYLWYFNMGLKRSEDIEPDSLLQYYKNVLYPNYKDLFEAKAILDYLQARVLRINQFAPEFITTDITGKKVSLKQLRGKYVLLNIWATWCVPCVSELPLLKKLRDDFSEDRLEIISISVDKTKADLENGIKKYALNWTHVFQDQGLITKYQIYNGIPSTFLIDKEGVLVFKQVGGFSDTGELRKLMMKNESRHE